MDGLTISPDGHWLATGGWKEKGIQLFDLRERKFERLLTPGEGGGDLRFRVAFAPDGRLIAATTTDEKRGYYAFRPDTWEREVVALTPRVLAPLPPVYSRAGALMAMSVSRTQIRLADPKTGKPFAHLTAQQQIDPSPLAFSPDGKRLAIATNRGAVQIWDISKIRKRLADMGLDWE
jgi:WD40 repeat protein